LLTWLFRELALTEAQRFWYMRLLKRLDTISLDDIFTCKIGGENDGRKEAQAVIARAMSENAGVKNKKYQQLMNLLMVGKLSSTVLLSTNRSHAATSPGVRPSIHPRR